MAGWLEVAANQAHGIPTPASGWAEQFGVPQGSLPPGPGRLEQLWGPAAVGEELRWVGES